VGAFDLSSTSSVLKKDLLKIGKIQFAQYQLSDDVDKSWYSSIGRSIHLMYSLHNKFHVDFVLLVWNISHKDILLDQD
jgi:hypothetical protein